jgi:hypothetical protein
MIMAPDFTLLGELPLFSSLQYNRSFWGIGDFELHTHPDAPCAAFLQQGAVLFPPDAPHKAMVIEDMSVKADDLTVKGVQLKGWARQRLCVPPLSLPEVLWQYTAGNWVEIIDQAAIRAALAGTVYQGYDYPESPTEGMYYLDISGIAPEMGGVRLDLGGAQIRNQYQNFGWDSYIGPAESALKTFALHNMIAPEDPGRAFPGLVCAPDQGRGIELPWRARFDKLDEFLSTIGETTGMGWDIRPNFSTHEFVFEVYPGRNLSAPPTLAVISPEMGNASGVELSRTLSGSANVAYVGGTGEDENRMILSVGSEDEGFSRRETWIDGGSLDDPIMINLLGNNRLKDMVPGTTLKAPTIDSGACRYERDWDLGDQVSVKGLGAAMAARVINVKEVYEADKPREIEVTFGSAPVTLGRLIRRMQNSTIR